MSRSRSRTRSRPHPRSSGALAVLDHPSRRDADPPRSRATSFRCGRCRIDVPLDAPGTRHRNHCPSCLWSRHVDDAPGDRSALESCGSSMEPIAITVRGDGEWVLVHRCTGCDEVHLNRVAADDNPLLLVRIAVRPLAQPPFPLDRLALV